MTWVRIEPVDAWFFGDGQPYTKDETPQASVHSRFPPTPLTLIGALRAGLALANGWKGRGVWSSSHDEILGSGPENTGRLSLRGPFLLLDGELLLAAPRHALSRTEDGNIRFALLELGDSLLCDFGVAVFPRLNAADRILRGWKPLAEAYVDSAAQARISRGQPPQTVVSEGTLVATESRIGIARDTKTHATGDGAMYSPQYLRLRSHASLAAEVLGVPDSWRWPQMVPFGGEGRLAAITPIEAPPLPSQPLEDSSEIAVVCSTLLRLPFVDGEIVLPHPGDGFFAALGVADVEIIAACIDRHVMIGGWNSLAPGPTALRPCLAPGTVFFCRGSGLGGLQAACATGLGLDAHLGFNQVWLAAIPR